MTTDSVEWATHNNPTVHAMRRAGASWDQVAAELARQNHELNKRIIDLSVIAPRKITTPDGGALIWHCPDNLVP